MFRVYRITTKTTNTTTTTSSYVTELYNDYDTTNKSNWNEITWGKFNNIYNFTVTLLCDY